MLKLAAHYKKIVIGLTSFSVLLGTAFFLMASTDTSSQANSKAQVAFKKRPSIDSNHSLASRIKEDMEAHSVKVASLDEAKAMLKYDFPVPTDTNHHKLEGIYVERNEILYLAYANDIYVVYHKVPEDISPEVIDASLQERSGEAATMVRGQRGIVAEPGPVPGLKNPRAGGSIGWYENGLQISIYSYSGVKSGELRAMAESMKY